MTTPPAGDDDRLLTELRTALGRAGPPTPAMVAAGRAAFSWGDVDGELAALTLDSLRDGVAGVRSAAGPPRTLVFEGRGTSVEAELTGSGLTGRLFPPAAGEVALLGPGGELVTATVDELGCFDVAGLPGGPVRLRCRTAAGTLLTDWFRR